MPTVYTMRELLHFVLLDTLEELDDTQSVHCNAEIADEALES